MTAASARLFLPAFTLLLFAAPAAAQDYPFRPVPFPDVRLDDGFWRPRIETNRTVTIPYAFEQCEQTSRIENFRVAGGLSERPWEGGFGFNDSDVSKVIEGAAYCLTVADDPALEQYLSDLVALYEAAQEGDGYLYTFQTARATIPEGTHVACAPHAERWDDIGMAHELYNAGHMYEAAVAYWQATGDRRLLDVARRNADLVCEVFGPDGRHDPPGHQEIELGLAKLYRATGDAKYLEQARFFLEQRGRPREDRPSYGPYSQDHAPVLEQDAAVGHAVRANYMYAAMADVAALGEDAAYLAAIDRIWRNVADHKLYLTGGVGASGAGEAYGADDELPNRTAYAETCAAIANVYWNHRMFLLHGDARYVDVMERSLYNGVISGVALDGKSFFYPNPLASTGEHARSPWFGCACCPSNITRFLASVGGYAYAVRDDALYVNLYAAGEARAAVAGGEVGLRVSTDYPWDGAVRVEVDPGEAPRDFELRLRLPGWAREQPVPSDLYTFTGAPAPPARHRSVAAGAAAGEWTAATADDHGYLVLRRRWSRGDAVELELPMPVRRVLAAERVAADRGRVALQRGPLVYCLEHPDVPGGQVHNLLLPDDAPLTAVPARSTDGVLAGTRVIDGEALATRWEGAGDARRLLSERVKVTAIPYAWWAHRGRGEMAVWLAREEAAAFPLPAPTLASAARASASGGEVRALNDQREPGSSGDHTHPFLHWWPRKGTTEWVQYDFNAPAEVSRVQVYWFDDTGRGECRVPASWRLLARAPGEEGWTPVAVAGGFPVHLDRYDEVRFAAREVTALRLEVQLQEGWAAGIHEWRVD